MPRTPRARPVENHPHGGRPPRRVHGGPPGADPPTYPGNPSTRGGHRTASLAGAQRWRPSASTSTCGRPRACCGAALRRSRARSHPFWSRTAGMHVRGIRSCSGVVTILLGEAVFFSSPALAAYAPDLLAMVDRIRSSEGRAGSAASVRGAVRCLLPQGTPLDSAAAPFLPPTLTTCSATLAAAAANRGMTSSSALAQAEEEGLTRLRHVLSRRRLRARTRRYVGTDHRPSAPPTTSATSARPKSARGCLAAAGCRKRSPGHAAYRPSPKNRTRQERGALPPGNGQDAIPWLSTESP